MPPLCRLATSAEQHERDLLSFHAWGMSLTLEQYLERESTLRATVWPGDGLRTWVLDDPKLDLVASCETLPMASEVMHAGRSHLGITEGVATVYVEERFRGKGFASLLMGEVAKNLRHEGKQAVILFSEVGEGLYARVGFQARPRRLHRLTASAQAPLEVELLSWEQVLLLTQEREFLAAQEHGGEGFAIHPSREQLDWHRARARYYERALGLPAMEVTGARKGGSWMLWLCAKKSDALHVLCSGVMAPGEARARSEVCSLLQAARVMAHRAEVSQVELWATDLPAPCWGALKEVEALELVTTPDTSIPMILPLDERVQSSHWIPSRATWV